MKKAETTQNDTPSLRTNRLVERRVIRLTMPWLWQMFGRIAHSRIEARPDMTSYIIRTLRHMPPERTLHDTRRWPTSK